MKVLIIRGNPRKNGFTRYLTDESPPRLDGRWSADHRHRPRFPRHYLFLLSSPPGPISFTPVCTMIRCRASWKRCSRPTSWICATPVYYFAIGSYLKNFFERTFPLTTEGLEVSAMNLLRNQLRYPDQWKGKKFISITVGALPAREAYEPINRDVPAHRRHTRPRTWWPIDPTLVPFASLSAFQTHDSEARRVAFVRAGHEAGTTGRLSETVMTDAALPLSTNDTSFRTYSNVYWENAHAIGARNVGSALFDRVAKEPEILMREMARTVDPRTTAHLKVANREFHFPDQDRHYRLTVDCGNAS